MSSKSQKIPKYVPTLKRKSNSENTESLLYYIKIQYKRQKINQIQIQE